MTEPTEITSNIADTTGRINSTNTTAGAPDYSTLFMKRGRPKMKPEDKKPRKRRCKKATVEKAGCEYFYRFTGLPIFKILFFSYSSSELIKHK
jgi:hypothetical protein